MANTTSSFPIDFDFYNADQEQVLFITDDVTGQDMTLEITNTSDEPITTVALSGAASATNCHFELIFRPDTLFNTPSALQLTDSQFELFVDKDAQGSIKPNADGTLSLFIKVKASWTLPVGGKLPIKLSLLRAAASDGTRGTRVMLKYKNLLHAGDTNSFSGFKETHLNIVNHRGKQNIPLHMGFVGANIVLNDGKSTSTLKLRISNISRKAIAIDAAANSKFTLVLEGGSEQEEWTLATVDQIDKTVVKYKRPGDAALIEATGVTEWIIPFAKLQKGQFIDIEISNLITNHPTGHANLYLHYENIPGYWDGEKTLIIEKSPFVFKNKNAGVGTSAPEMKLDVVGALGVRNEAAWDHVYIEHDGGTAFLNAGGAEHGMALRVGTGANGSYKGQDYTDVMRLHPNGNVGVGTTSNEGRLSVVPPKDGRGLEVLSPSAGNTHLPWSDNWNYISGNGVIFRDKSHNETIKIDNTANAIAVNYGPWALANNKFAEFKTNYKNDGNRGQVHLYAPSNYYENTPVITLAGNYGAGGQVGIGKKEPEALLDVNGNILTKALNVNSNRQFNKILAGHMLCGSHGGGVKEVRIDFPQAFTLKPMCVCTVRGEGFNNDTFAVTVKYIDTTHFKVNIARIDSHMGGWGQNVRLDWFAFEIEGLTGF